MWVWQASFHSITSWENRTNELPIISECLNILWRDLCQRTFIDHPSLEQFTRLAQALFGLIGSDWRNRKYFPWHLVWSYCSSLLFLFCHRLERWTLSWPPWEIYLTRRSLKPFHLTSLMILYTVVFWKRIWLSLSNVSASDPFCHDRVQEHIKIER